MAVRWAIYGIGWHAGAAMAPALKRAENTELAAVCSRDMGRAKAFAAKFEVPKAYDSYEAMLSDPDIDVVYLATPNNLHREQTERAAAAGKHVLCEKPMALTEGDCQAMIDACQQAGVKLGTVFQNRCHPAHLEARRLVAEGEVGEVLRVSAEFSINPPGPLPWKEWRWDLAQGGGAAIMAIGVHTFDLLRFVLGREPLAASALSDEDLARNRLDDIMTCLFRFEGGIQAIAMYGLHTPDTRNDLDIYGTRAHVIGEGTVGPLYRGRLRVTRDNVSTEVVYQNPHPQWGLYQRLSESFNESVLEGREPIATGYDGLQACRMTIATLESARQARVMSIG